MVYPKEAGLPFGGPGFFPYVRLEIHYNNPKKREGLIDASGIRFHFTSILRPYDAGILEVGLQYTDKMAIPPGQVAFPLSGICHSECTDKALPPQGIVLFASQLHAHMASHVLWTQHIRKGTELPMINSDYHFTTHWQEIRPLNQMVNVLPGDTLITTCVYDTLKREKVTLGGLGITDEMCVNYIHYFPKTDLEVCKSSVDSDSLSAYFDWLKINGENVESSNPISENYKNVRWTEERIEELRKLYETGSLSVQCNKSSGDRFPGQWEHRPQQIIINPLAPKTGKC